MTLPAPPKLTPVAPAALDRLSAKRREAVEALLAEAEEARREAQEARRQYHALRIAAKAKAIRWESEVLEINGQGTLLPREGGS